MLRYTGVPVCCCLWLVDLLLTVALTFHAVAALMCPGVLVFVAEGLLLTVARACQLRQLRNRMVRLVGRQASKYTCIDPLLTESSAQLVGGSHGANGEVRCAQRCYVCVGALSCSQILAPP